MRSKLLVSSLKVPSHGLTGVGIKVLSQFLLFIIPHPPVAGPVAVLKCAGAEPSAPKIKYLQLLTPKHAKQSSVRSGFSALFFDAIPRQKAASIFNAPLRFKDYLDRFRWLNHGDVASSKCKYRMSGIKRTDATVSICCPPTNATFSRRRIS